MKKKDRTKKRKESRKIEEPYNREGPPVFFDYLAY